MDQLGDGPRLNYLDPRLSNTNFQPLPVKIDKEKDQQIIDTWLAERGKFQINPYYAIRRPRCEITLNGAKQALRNCLAIVEKLNKTQEELRNKVETMSSNEWKQKTLDIGSLKDEFDKSILLFEDNTILKSLKSLVVKRAKKRLNQKKQKKFRQEQHKIKKEKQIEIDKNIDRWLESKKEEVERAKMEEKMKKDADCVLYEVTKKKSEARKQLSLISALVKLRTVRDAMATQRGEKLSLEDRKAFGHVTEKLIRMWENSYQNYCKEEQCLKVMLEHNATMDSKAAINAKQARIVDDWESLLFGPKDAPVNNPTFWALTSADRDMETFIAIRKSWDTFLRASGSAIPLGWVIPPETPNESWAPFLKND
ncbi:U11/U12 small nuclear ribonucleoprotein 59 kDa protein-like [Tribolium madens]|uniref:U11/U12 small nuclear ribonucleoprotein 59 kDa protein-like n=1 Tax=Tribolium madens TaxID=41895 RepID=UPI001CF73F62|nr:U11/U12 small nuclear ribonucleoprotein 59 kDa protein-like [Tribolium madens]